jgi:hypothetical protein
MSDSIATALGRLIQTELERRFYSITRDELTEHRGKILSLMQRRFGAGFSRELIRQVAAIQFDQLLGSTD